MLRAYLFLSIFIPLTFLFAASALFWTLVDASGSAYAFHARLWARLSLLMAGARITLFGEENLPDGPVIFMSKSPEQF